MSSQRPQLSGSLIVVNTVAIAGFIIPKRVMSISVAGSTAASASKIMMTANKKPTVSAPTVEESVTALVAPEMTSF